LAIAEPLPSEMVVVRAPQAWDPLFSPVFRMFWIASLASNTGTWIHEVGSGWLMSSLDSSPHMVSAVRVVMSLPILFLAIPAGALADRVDRRRLLIGIQSLLMTITSVLAAATYFGAITPYWLLALTFAMGLGMVLHVPTWQASIPELVPREQIPQAVALGSLSFNLARSVGPAIGGLLIASFGIWIAFAVNAFSFGVVLWAIIRWKPAPRPARELEPYFASIRTVVLLSVRERVIRNVLIRVFLFVIPASALWSLMPLIVRDQLDWDAKGFGYLVGAIGMGAVAAAAWLPRMRSLVGLDHTVFGGMCLFSIGLAVASLSTSKGHTLITMLILGIGWMTVLTTLNSTVQMTVANSIRARGMACYLSVFAAGMAAGSWTWGAIANLYSPGFAMLVAAAVIPIQAVAGMMLPIEKRSPESR